MVWYDSSDGWSGISETLVPCKSRSLERLIDSTYQNGNAMATTTVSRIAALMSWDGTPERSLQNGAALDCTAIKTPLARPGGGPPCLPESPGSFRRCL